MSRVSVDIKSYLNRIGYPESDEVRPDFETLGRVQLAHACAIPFENIDVILKKPIALDIASVQKKLVASRRGGYCFEQNMLIIEVLKHIGFDVQALSARVRVGRTREFTPPRTHLFARVNLEGVPWLVDVGVGGMTPTAPLRMDISDPQTTLHDTRRIIQGENANNLPRWFHQVLLDDVWHDIYDFTGEEMPMIDREVGNWWTSTNPESKFRQSIMAALAVPDGSRHSLSTHQYVRRSAGNVLEKIEIKTSAQMVSILADRFGVDLPETTAFGIEGL